ncbi:DNA-binding response regulator [Cupriavidus necator]|uniref:DNA-binding response regulator n=1 Tax=Cupriavidus necator TaxID=106590 RepID=UPI00278BAB9E|nr:DNA-binding response regulator [Cupriavidus necator]MDQ0141252.1 DNA-binding NarL/FixJ family response regulator [Cupriavidus necator]
MSWINLGTPHPAQVLQYGGEAHAVVIDDMPIYRHGVMRLLGEIPGISRVEPVETEVLAARNRRLPAPALLVFGMPSDLADGWNQLRQASLVLRPRRLLLISDNMWLRMPPGLDPRFARSLCRSASVATIERDVRALLDLPPATTGRVEPDAATASPRQPFHAFA